MRLTFLALFIFASSLSAMGLESTSVVDNFCLDRRDISFVKDLTLDSKNLMPFNNRGGLGGGGVCWWHSRFQRNALYLTIYQPKLPKPKRAEVITLINQIRKAEKVITIAGYENFSEFAEENQNLIQSELERWQKSDSILHFSWLKGLSGKAVNSQEKMKEIMDAIYEEVEIQKNIAYTTVQIKGVAAHSWLVVRMNKTEDGYELEVLDSNLSDQTMFYNYQHGDTHLVYKGTPSFHFTPILGYTEEMKKINEIITNRCGH